MGCVHVLSVAQHSPLLNPYALYVVELFIIFLQIGMCLSFHTTTLIIAGQLKQSGRLMVVLGPACSRDSNPAYRNISWWVYSWSPPLNSSLSCSPTTPTDTLTTSHRTPHTVSLSQGPHEI